MEKVVIVMAAWNEAENIEKMINTLFDDIFPQIKADMHLLVVDNYSSDGMTEIVQKEAKKRKKLHLIQQGEKRGLGNAYVKGFKYAMKELKADAVMEMDADGQHPPEFVVPMVEAYLAGADYVIGSRYIRGGSVPKEWEFFRRFLSFAGNLYIRFVFLNFKIHDVTTGFRLTKVKGVLDKINLDTLRETEKFAYKIDLLYKSNKLSKKTVEVPLIFKPRITDKSKFNSNELLSTFKLATVIGLQDKTQFIKFAVTGLVGYLVNATGLFVMTMLNAPSIIAWSLPVELSIISNFLINNAWTFKSNKITGINKLLAKFLQFNLTSAGALVIQLVCGLVVDAVFGVGPSPVFGIDYRQLSLPFIIIFFVLPYNYFMYKKVIWRVNRPKK